MWLKNMARTGVWCLALTGIGCAAVSEPPAATAAPIAGRGRTALVAPGKRAAPVIASTPQYTLQPHTRSPLVPAVVIQPAPLAETWDGKGKCEGIASFYAGKFLGRRTANGELYTGKAMTAAHRVLPFGTYVRVTNLQNGLDVIVRINDRGPFVAGRVIDLSPAAAKKLHMTQKGVVPVKLELVAAWIAATE